MNHSYCGACWQMMISGKYRPLAELNRVQPKVSITEVKKEDAGAATVTVEVENVRQTYKHANNRVVDSGGKDLRLFRDGQLVSYRDGDLFAKGQTPPRAANRSPAVR